LGSSNISAAIQQKTGPTLEAIKNLSRNAQMYPKKTFLVLKQALGVFIFQETYSIGHTSLSHVHMQPTKPIQSNTLRKRRLRDLQL
jgi:hypothetical protein